MCFLGIWTSSFEKVLLGLQTARSRRALLTPALPHESGPASSRGLAHHLSALASLVQGSVFLPSNAAQKYRGILMELKEHLSYKILVSKVHVNLCSSSKVQVMFGLLFEKGYSTCMHLHVIIFASKSISFPGRLKSTNTKNVFQDISRGENTDEHW
jgi:hypothetical protein